MPRLLLLLITLLVALLAAAPVQASSKQFTIFEAPRELSSDDAVLRTQTLDEIREMGVGWVRMVLYWRDVAPAAKSRRKPDFAETDPASYDWTKYDRAITEARERGMKVLLTLSGPVPTWATARNRGSTYKPSRTEFGRFVQAAGARYRDAVRYWSIWNEPNHPQFLRPQFREKRPYSPRLYRWLWRAAVKGLLRSGNGRDRMLAGETAPRGTPRVVAPVTFVRRFFCRGCGDLNVDGWAHHPYTTRAGPKFRPPNRNDVTIGVLSRLTRALDRETRNGIGLYLNEFGIQSKPDPFVGVSETRQAEYRSIAERIAYRNRRVRSFSQYLMRDDLPRAGSRFERYSGFESGLRHSDGDPKRSLAAFRLPLVADRGRRRVTLWGLVRPAEGRTRVTIQYRSGKKRWRRLKRDSTNRRGYWRTTTRYRRGRQYRVRWNGSVGPPTRPYR